MATEANRISKLAPMRLGEVVLSLLLVGAAHDAVVHASQEHLSPPPPSPSPPPFPPDFNDEDRWMHSWAPNVKGLARYDAWAAAYLANTTMHPGSVRNDNPSYPGGKQCPPGTLTDAMHRDYGAVPGCSQVCMHGHFLDVFESRGGRLGGSCEDDGCNDYVGESWVANIQYFKYACSPRGPTIDPTCLQDGWRSMESEACMHQLDLLYEFMHTRNTSDGGTAARRRFAGIRGASMPWHEVVALVVAIVAACAACSALVLLCCILEHRPELIRPGGGIDKHDSIGGGSLRRVEVFRGLRVAEINEGLPGSASKAVVTRDGAVYEWAATNVLRTRAQQGGADGDDPADGGVSGVRRASARGTGEGQTPSALFSPGPKLLGPGVRISPSPAQPME